LENIDGEAWGDEEDGIDIDMGEDILGEDKETGDQLLDGDASNMDSDIFVPPSAGADYLKQYHK